MKERQFKKVARENGIWIPNFILFLDNLSFKEKGILAKIYHLDNEEGCFANNQYFSEFFGISKVQISKYVSRLTQKGYIENELNQAKGNKRTLRCLINDNENVSTP